MKIVHCVEMHAPANEAEGLRKSRAQKSWSYLYSQRGMVPAHYGEYQRTAATIGDPRPLPFLKDVLAAGMAKAGEDDIVCFTNDDNFLHPELPDALLLHASIWDACTAQRCEFKANPMPGFMEPPEHFANKGERHLGRDLFAARKSWLMRWWNEIPDAILGAPMFDLHLAALVRWTKGFPTTRRNLEDIIPCCELPRGYVAHDWHQPVWAQQNSNTPSHKHNARWFQQWAAKRLPQLTFINGQI